MGGSSSAEKGSPFSSRSVRLSACQRPPAKRVSWVTTASSTTRSRRSRSTRSESTSDSRSRVSKSFLHVSPSRAKRRARQLLRLQPAVAAVAALAKDQARIAELLDPELAVVREPAVERLGVGLGLVEEIAIPHRRGLDRVVRRGVEQERVAARALQPAPRALGRVVRIERPRDQDGRRTRPARARPVSLARRVPRRRRPACRRPGTDTRSRARRRTAGWRRRGRTARLRPARRSCRVASRRCRRRSALR